MNDLFNTLIEPDSSAISWIYYELESGSMHITFTTSVEENVVYIYRDVDEDLASKFLQHPSGKNFHDMIKGKFSCDKITL